MEKFIADKKVLTVTVLEDQTTPTKQEMVKVTFTDESTETMPKLRFELISTEKVSDATGVQNKIKEKVGADLFSLLHEYGIKFGEIEGVVETCVNFANAGLERATDVLFGFTQRNLPLIEINKIVLEDAKKNNNGASSTGSTADSSAQG